MENKDINKRKIAARLRVAKDLANKKGFTWAENYIKKKLPELYPGNEKFFVPVNCAGILRMVINGASVDRVSKRVIEDHKFILGTWRAIPKNHRK